MKIKLAWERVKSFVDGIVSYWTHARILAMDWSALKPDTWYFVCAWVKFDKDGRRIDEMLVTAQGDELDAKALAKILQRVKA